MAGYREVSSTEIEALVPQVQFADVVDIVLDSTAVWVLDAVPPFITRVSHDGSGLLRFGFKGEGPGELAWPVALQLTEEPGGIRALARTSGK